jgi:hypothetical protein
MPREHELWPSRPRPPVQSMSTAKASISRGIVALLFGLLFVSPHLVRVIKLGSFRDYTPFSAISPSPMVWDETFLYAAQANYSLQQHRLANDTDSYEHRNEPFPYSVLPAEFEVGLAKLLGGLGRAQILCHFLFPAITAWVLIGLFAQAGASLGLAALLALLVLVLGFSSRTLIHGDIAFFEHGLRGRFWDTLQAARNPNPNISFPLFLATALTAASALRRRSAKLFLLSGAIGGLLFYAYTFYAMAWCAASVFLLILSFWRPSRVPKAVGWMLLTEGLLGLPFVWWTHASKQTGAYASRTFRLGLYFKHAPSTEAIQLTLLWGGALVIAGLCWFLLERAETAGDVDSRSTANAALLVFWLAALGAIAGMNMQVVTGFNLQAENHFPHMVIQPTVLLVFFLLFVRLQRHWRRQGADAIWTGAFVVVFLASALSQVTAAVNTARFHRIDPNNRMLFEWLEKHTRIGDVVATTNLQLCTEIPVYTHNSVLLAEGSRTSGTNEELIE